MYKINEKKRKPYTIALRTLLLLSGVFLLNACSPLSVIVSSSGEQPIPVEESVSDSVYQAVEVDRAAVEVGVGSPIPVHVIVSGTLPNTCAQVEYVEQRQEGSTFFFEISTLSSNAEGCIQDSLPFRMTIPLNVIDLPAGIYTIMANGVSSTFELETGNTSSELPAADVPLVKDDIQVDEVNVDLGTGSPIPVHAVVSLNLPNTCAQLGEVRLHREGTTFYVRLIAQSPAGADCQEDSIPFRLEIPLNIVNLPQGPYAVDVNGVSASFDPRTLDEGNLIAVEHVGVQIGEGSPILVEIIASGTWPDLCAQISEVHSSIEDFHIELTILSSTTDSCPPDRLGLPFRFALPLNTVEMPEGEYTISVNGMAQNTFEFPVKP